MSYYNERRTVETLLFPLAFEVVCMAGLPDVPERAAVVESFAAASEEVMPRAMTPRQKSRLWNRVAGLIFDHITEPAKSYIHPSAKTALVLYYFLSNMIEQGSYTINPDSTFSRALDLFLPTVQPWVDEAKFDKSAYKEARRLLLRLHRDGYFKDVEWVIDFEDSIS